MIELLTQNKYITNLIKVGLSIFKCKKVYNFWEKYVVPLQ